MKSPFNACWLRTLNLLLFLVASSAASYSQLDIVEVPLKMQYGFEPFKAQLNLLKKGNWSDKPIYKCLPKVKGVPSTWTDTFVDYIWFDLHQFVHQNFKVGKLTKAEMEQIRKTMYLLTDTRLFSDKPIKCFVAVVAGKKNGILKYKIDKNHNLDFSDDKEQNHAGETAHLKDIHPLDGLDTLVYETLRQGNVVKLRVPVEIHRWDNSLVYLLKHHAVATLHEKKVYIRSPHGYTSYDPAELMLENWNDTKHQDILMEDEFITVENNIYKFLRVDMNKEVLVFKKVPSDTIIFSPHLGFYAPLFDAVDIDDNKVSLKSYRGKFLFLEFWKTDEFDMVNHTRYKDMAFRNNTKKNIQFLSLVNVAPDDQAQLPDVIKKHKLGWSQVVINEKPAIQRAYWIFDSYPMNFLIDPEGKIVLKQIPYRDLKNIINRFVYP
jgi:hypothetical protein